MQDEALATALEREHQEIDAGIEAYTAAPADREPLARAIDALRRHIYLEEELLFPVLREVEPALAAPVFVMLREHATIWDILEVLEHALNTNADIDTGLRLCKQLADQLLNHNFKEEKVLYPQADGLLSQDAADSLRRFLDSGELPDGWVCQLA